MAGLDKPINGKVSLISPALDPNSTTVEVWVQAPNPDQQLRPGTTAQIAITAQTVKDALVVPSAALLNAKGDAAQVLVVNSQNQAMSRDVKTGITTGQQVQIVSGLKPGEVVVTEGAYGLPDKTKVKIEKPETESAGEGAKDKEKDDDAKSGKGGDDAAKPDMVRNPGKSTPSAGNYAKAKPDAGSKKAAQIKSQWQERQRIKGLARDGDEPKLTNHTDVNAIPAPRRHWLAQNSTTVIFPISS